MEAANAFLEFINGYLWGIPMVVLLMGTHIFMTIRTKGVQRKLFRGIRLSVTRDPDSHGDVSQFGALTTALASTIGTGNIIGVGTAIALGGPGAVLWTWLTGVFGIATKYAEALISVKYRVRSEDGTMLGGAMYALENGLPERYGSAWRKPGRVLGLIFAALTALACFGAGCMVQTNAVASLVQENFGIDTWITGAVMVVLVGLVIFGGVQSIARVCEKLVPLMSALYIVGCIVILFINHEFVWQALCLICGAAFTPRAAGGGFVGTTIMMAARFGIARGLFSNEAGLGTAPLVAAAARTRNPVRQALVSMTGTFWDTVVVCAFTGIVLVSTILAHPEVAPVATAGDGALLTTVAFGSIPVVGVVVLVLGMITFSYSTMLGWSYYGDRAISYLFGKKGITPYRVAFCIVAFLGSLGSVAIVWNAADTLNALMAVPNLIAVLLLSGVIARETQHYLWEDNLDERDVSIAGIAETEEADSPVVAPG